MSTTPPLIKKTLLVINTGSAKKRYIFQRIKKMGIHTIVVNKEKNRTQPYVDQWIIADTYNHDQVLQTIRSFLLENPDVKIDGAITFWEDDVLLLAKVCQEFGFLGNTLETATVTRDKFQMHEVLRETNQHFIRQALVTSEDDLANAIQKIGFPGVIKPVSGSDSEFVVMINNREEAYEAYEYLVQNCNPDFNPIFLFNDRHFLYQEYVDGEEFSMECYCQHGVPQVVGVLEKTAMEQPFFMETGDYIPPRISPETKQKLVKATEGALIVLGVQNSLAHVEIKMSKSGPKIIEAASRLGGDYTWETVQKAYEFDLIRAGVEIALGINVTQTAIEATTFIMAKYLIPKQSGIITKMSGIEELKKNPNIVNFAIHKKVGDSVLVPPNGFENIGWILAKGVSYAETERVISAVTDSVIIEVAPFRGSSSFGKTKRKNRLSPAMLETSKLLGGARIERIRNIKNDDIKNLRIGIACNTYQGAGGDVEQELTSVGKNIETTLLERGYQVTFIDFNDIQKVLKTLKNSPPDLIFNVCERMNDSSLLEPHAASLLDIFQIPYTGSNPTTLALCIDKIRVKKLLSYHNIPTPKWDYVYESGEPIRNDLRFPLIVKPANSDNSVGITNDSVVTDKKQLLRQVEKVLTELHSPALIEEYIEGDEYDVPILGNGEDDLRVLPLSRSIFSEMPENYWHIYPYEAKWANDPAYKKIIVQRPPKNIGKKLEALLSEIAIDTYNILDCHDYGRVEIRVDKNDNPYVLELNPNPSINRGNCVPACAELLGQDYGDFLEEIIRLAIKRYKDKPPYYHLQTNII